MFETFNRGFMKTLISFGNGELEIVFDYLKKHGKSQSYIESAEKCLNLAEDGDPEIQYAISMVYQWGLMCESDHKKSYCWAKRSYDQGFAPAIFSIANYYYTGAAGVNHDYKKCLGLMQLSASENFIPALTTLGFLYFYDENIVKKDMDKSITYYKKAKRLGSTRAINSLFEIYKEISDYDNILKIVPDLLEAAENGCHTSHHTVSYLYAKGKYGLEKNKRKFEFHQKKQLEIEERIFDSYCR